MEKRLNLKSFIRRVAAFVVPTLILISIAIVAWFSQREQREPLEAEMATAPMKTSGIHDPDIVRAREQALPINASKSTTEARRVPPPLQTIEPKLEEVEYAFKHFEEQLQKARTGDVSAIVNLNAALRMCDEKSEEERGYRPPECAWLPIKGLQARVSLLDEFARAEKASPQVKAMLAGQLLSNAEKVPELLAGKNIFTDEQLRRHVEALATSALEAGNREAALLLSGIHRYGRAGPRDLSKAYGYALVAAELNARIQPDTLDSLRKYLSPYEINQAEALRDSFFRSGSDAR
ncbi:hypothetical protein [Roseateles amylovorans]|uniref:Sel1 repeat family protein n=1 Tax=Roseateles amylovorans TaxID=2978473 RepID=A0ABY6B4B9_9BURK|nr:hypothetical protein [Roseateles amylovorans]UXH80218.1 hypothetical protein N4261_10200 [Roseateles amylovorans]